MGTFNVNNLIGGNVAGDLSALGQSDILARLNAAQSAQVQPGFGEKLMKLIEAGDYEALAAITPAGKVRDADVNAANMVDNTDDTNNIAAAALLDGLSAIEAIGADNEGSDAAKVSFVNALTPEERLRAGNELMAYAFKKIAALLDTPEEEFSSSLMVAFNPEDADQFAAIMWYIDTTVKLINEKDAGAFAGNTKQDDTLIDILGKDNSAALSDLATGLRKEKFHLEMAFRLIGVHEMISGMVAEKSNQNVATGIPQAANPAALGMSVSDLARAFGSLIKEELTSTMERVRMITSGQAEMTDLERAAVQLGTVNSEILKAALNGAGTPNSAVFENVNLVAAKPVNTENVNAEVKADANTEVKADANTDVKAGANTKGKADVNAEVRADANNGVRANVNTDIKANANTEVTNDVEVDDVQVNTAINTKANKEIGAEVDTEINTEAKADVKVKPTAKKAADGFELPLSARESTHKMARDRVEAANMRAFESVNVAVKAKVSSEGSVGLPISARESVNKGVADTVAPASGKAADVINVANNAQVKVSAAHDVAIPVSAKESLNKSAVDNGANVEKKISGNINININTNEAHVKNVSADDVEIPVSVRESVNRGAANNAAHVEKKAPESVTPEAAKVRPVSGNNVEIPVSAGESANKKAPEKAVFADKKVADNVNTTVKTDNVSVDKKVADNVNTSVKTDNVSVDKKVTDNVNTTVKTDNVFVNNKVADDVNTTVKTDNVSVNNKVADSVNTAVKTDNVSVNNKVADGVNNTPAKADSIVNNADVETNVDDNVEKAPVNAAKESTYRKASENVDFAAKAGNPSADGVKATASAAEHVVSNKLNDNKKSNDSAKPSTQKAAVNTEKSTAAVNTASDNTAASKPETPAQNESAVKAKRDNANADAGSNASAAKPNVNVNGKAENADNGKISDGRLSINNNLTFSGLESNAVESEEASSGGSEFSSAEPVSHKAASIEHTEKAQAASSRFDSEAVIRQINERLQQAVRNGAHEVRMTLRPEALGEVRMSIRVEGDVVMARMQVENRQVKAIVESNLQSLKDMLEKHNMQFGAVSVDVGTDADTNRSPRQAWQELAEAAEMSGARRFREGVAAEGSDGGEEIDALGGARGSDTGRRFGNNTFEYFI